LQYINVSGQCIAVRNYRCISPGLECMQDTTPDQDSLHQLVQELVHK